MLPNEIKRNALFVAFNHEDLEIPCFLRATRLFGHKICKELEKENDNVISVLKRKKNSSRSNSMRTPKFIHKVKQTIIEANFKKVAYVWKDNQK